MLQARRRGIEYGEDHIWELAMAFSRPLRGLMDGASPVPTAPAVGDSLAPLAALPRGIFVLLCLWLAASARPLLGAERAQPRLCIEYLPGILYEDEPITVCARVEASGAANSAFRLTTTLRDGSGAALALETADGSAKADEPWRRSATLRVASGSPARLELRLAPAGGAAATVVVRVLEARKPLPPLRVSGMRLVDASGQRVLVRIEHRIYQREESWPIIRWIRYRLYGDRVSFRRVLLLGDDLGAPRDGYLAHLAGSERPFETSLVSVPSSSRKVAPPVLRAVAALTRAKPKERPGLAALSLGHCEPDSGTDVLQFGRALELIVQQLEARGCGHFVLVSPVGPSHLRKRLAPYVRAVERVAFNYKARFLDLRGRMNDEHWAGGQKDGQLMLRLPNAKGHRAIADAIASYLTSIRR